LARYLAASSKGNESAELVELRGFASDNVFDAFALVQLQAGGTHCQKPIFHVQVRTPKGEELTREQWAHVADRIEKQLGFDDQPRAIVFHQKDGHRHMHLAWSRIDAETMHAIDPGLYKRKLKEICRKLEKEMGLQQVRNEREPDEKTQPPARPEFEQGRRLKTDVKAIREGIRGCWDASATGAAFVAALDKKGLVLAKGDKRSFVVVDEMGGYHALGKRITGATAEQTRAKLADLKAAKLPTVEKAQTMQRERREQEKGAMDDQQDMTDEDRRKQALQKDEEERRAAVAKEEEQRRQAVKEEDERREQAVAEEEARREEGNREEEKRQAEYKAQADRQVEQAREMEAQEERLAAYREEIARRAEEAKREEERNRGAQAEGRAREGEIRNPHSRYGQALAQHYDVKDPYGSLSRSAMAEYGAFLRDRERLSQQIAKADDPKEREALELRKRIESAEYMAITSERIAQQSYVIQGKPIKRDESLPEELQPEQNKEYHLQMKRAEEFRKEAQELRGQFRELHAERSQGRDERTAPEAAKKTPEQKADKEPERQPQAAKQNQDRAASIMVQERQPGKPRGEPQPLQDFVKGLPDEKARQPLPQSPAELRNNPAARRAHYAGLVAEQQRGPALDRMGEDMKAGRPLNADDVRKLSQTDREKIKENGEGQLKELIQQRQRERTHERER
jgi:hypothetical protein